MHLGRGSNNWIPIDSSIFYFFPPRDAAWDTEEEGGMGEGSTSVWLNRDEAKVSVDRLGK